MLHRGRLFGRNSDYVPLVLCSSNKLLNVFHSHVSGLASKLANCKFRFLETKCFSCLVIMCRYIWFEENDIGNNWFPRAAKVETNEITDSRWTTVGKRRFQLIPSLRSPSKLSPRSLNLVSPAPAHAPMDFPQANWLCQVYQPLLRVMIRTMSQVCTVLTELANCKM